MTDTYKTTVEEILKKALVGKSVRMDDGQFHTVEKCYLDVDYADSPYENDLIKLVLVTETDNEFLYKNIIISDELCGVIDSSRMDIEIKGVRTITPENAGSELYGDTVVCVLDE